MGLQTRSVRPIQQASERVLVKAVIALRIPIGSRGCELLSGDLGKEKKLSGQNQRRVRLCPGSLLRRLAAVNCVFRPIEITLSRRLGIVARLGRIPLPIENTP